VDHLDRGCSPNERSVVGTERLSDGKYEYRAKTLSASKNAPSDRFVKRRRAAVFRRDQPIELLLD